MWWGRLVLMGAAASAAATAPGAAQVAAAEPETVVVHATRSCVTEQADGSRTLSYDCLTAELQASAEGQGDGHTPTLDARALTGRGNPEALGTFSYTATAIRMVKNFGHSVYPERPAAPSPPTACFPKEANRMRTALDPRPPFMPASKSCEASNPFQRPGAAYPNHRARSRSASHLRLRG